MSAKSGRSRPRPALAGSRHVPPPRFGWADMTKPRARPTRMGSKPGLRPVGSCRSPLRWRHESRGEPLASVETAQEITPQECRVAELFSGTVDPACQQNGQQPVVRQRGQQSANPVAWAAKDAVPPQAQAGTDGATRLPFSWSAAWRSCHVSFARLDVRKAGQERGSRSAA
jgi:hypothetical protein